MATETFKNMQSLYETLMATPQAVDSAKVKGIKQEIGDLMRFAEGINDQIEQGSKKNTIINASSMESYRYAFNSILANAKNLNPKELEPLMPMLRQGLVYVETLLKQAHTHNKENIEGLKKGVLELEEKVAPSAKGPR